MLTKIKKQIEMYQETRGEVYPRGTDLAKALSENGLIFGITGNGNKRVFFNSDKAKEWQKNTGGSLGNIYWMLETTRPEAVIALVSESNGMTAPLKTWMDLRGLTASQLADKTDVCAVNISCYLNHKGLPGIVNANKIAKTLGVHTEQIEW